MKKKIILLYVLILNVLFAVSMSSALREIQTKESPFRPFPDSLTHKMTVCPTAKLIQEKKDVWIHSDSENHDYSFLFNNPIGSNVKATSISGNEGHPSVVVDYNKDPFLLYDYSDSSQLPDSDIYVQRSQDGGVTWPDDLLWKWETEGVAESHPDLSMMADGYRAYGTHTVNISEPILYLHDYININMPNTWKIYNFDLSPEISYVRDTAVTTFSINTISLCAVVDLTYHEYNLEDTMVILWNTDNGRGSWPGLFVINTDENDGHSLPISHITADSGESIFVAYQIETSEMKSEIYGAYCSSTELVFEHWNETEISQSNGNSTHPSICVSGTYIYIVCEDDSAGNQDIVCYSSATGDYWRKDIVANAVGDEVNPVITADGDKATCLFVKNGDLYESKTENGGLSWSDPSQVNEIDGTVIDGYRSIDTDGIFGVWTDIREENQNIYLDEVGPTPVLSIGESIGGMKVKTTITNTGNAPSENLRWKIELDGIVIPESKTGMISTLDVGETKEVKTDFFFGLGPITITVTAGHLVKGAHGFGFGPYLVIT